MNLKIYLPYFFFMILHYCNAQSTCHSLEFDGIDDHLTCTSPIQGTADYSIDVRFKSAGTNSGSCSNSNLNNFRWLFSSANNEFGVGNCGGNLQIIYKPSCPFGNWLCSSLPPLPINDGDWNHFVITRDAISINYYLNGIKITNFMSGANDMTGLFSIGKAGTGSSGLPWKGEIGEFRIWNRVLSETEIADGYNCQLNGSENGLVTYYNFNETNLGYVEDLTTVQNHGTLNNFVANPFVNLSNSFCDPCNDCITQQVNISTGYDPSSQSYLNPVTPDPLWTLVAVPPSAVGVAAPQAPFVINKFSSWTNLPNAGWLSPYQVSSFSTNNWCSGVSCQDCDSYQFDRCFCVPESGEVRLNFDVMHDDFFYIALTGPNGYSTIIYEACDQPVGGSYFQVPRSVDTTLILPKGKYCLEANLFNVGGVAMGFALEGNIEGVALETDSCCANVGTISGTVYNDLDCDGVLDLNNNNLLDPPLSGWQVALCALDGTPCEHDNYRCKWSLYLYKCDSWQLLIKGGCTVRLDAICPFRRSNKHHGNGDRVSTGKFWKL